MPTEPQRFDPERILAVLERHGLDYVMVGGFASQLHGARRQTYDLDSVPTATEANDDRLAAALRKLGARGYCRQSPYCQTSPESADDTPSSVARSW